MNLYPRLCKIRHWKQTQPTIISYYLVVVFGDLNRPDSSSVFLHAGFHYLTLFPFSNKNIPSLKTLTSPSLPPETTLPLSEVRAKEVTPCKWASFITYIILPVFIC